jgi:RNA polymerase sigma-70 factor (ECF subfamily)
MAISTDKSDEAALCARAREGDAGARAEIYRRHAPRVYTLAVRMLQKRQQAEEVLQDTFVKVLTRLDGFRGEASLATWIRSIAVNECLQVIRSPWRKRGLPLIEHPAEHDSPDRGIDLERALARLPLTTRAVVWMHDVEGYTHKEIARRMGKSVSFSKSRLARGHRALRSELTEEGQTCMPALNNS